MKTIPLTTCSNSIEANVIKGLLENNGIDCYLTNEHFSNLMPHFTGIMGAGVQIMINESDLPMAQELIAAQSKDQPTICPNCHSQNVHYELGAAKGIKMIFVFLSVLFGVPFGNIKRIYVCKDCKTEF